MKREEFMRELEYLLRDIPESDRMDAVAYYNDYFDEAGIENEQRVIQELGSPEKVAKTMKEDLGKMDYQEPSGYEEPRGYEEPSGYEEPKGYKEPSGYEEPRGYRQSRDYEENKGYHNTYDYSGSSNQTEKKKIPWLWIIIIAVLTFPLWIGVVAGLFGGVVGLLGGLFGLTVGLFGSGTGMVIGGIALLIVGILRIAVSPLEGVASVGVGALLAAIGLLLILLFTWLAFRWIPALFKSIVNAIKNVSHRNEGGN